jgi:hypothetical protein
MDKSMVLQSTAPVSQQKQSQQNATNTINLQRKCDKINDRVRYPAAHSDLVPGSSPAFAREAREGRHAEARRAKAGVCGASFGLASHLRSLRELRLGEPAQPLVAKREKAAAP